MTPMTMSSQIHTRELACFFDHNPSSIVGDWKNSFLKPNTFILDIFSKSISDFLGNVHDFGFSDTFKVWQCNFSIFDIDRSDFKYLP